MPPAFASTTISSADELLFGVVSFLPQMDKDVVVDAIAGTKSYLFETFSEKQQIDALATIVQAINKT